MAAWSGAIPTDWETRQPVEIRCGRASHSSWMATPRCQIAVARYASMVELRREMHPRRARMRHGARSTGGGGESNPMRHASARGRHGHQTRQAAASRDLWNVRGARGDREGVLHRSRDCRGARGSRGGQGGIPAVRSRDTVTATPSAPNNRPAAHVDSDTPRSPQATAGQLHRGALRSNAGPNRLRRKTADRPAKLTSYTGPGR